MKFEEYYDSFTSSERENFQRYCRRLLKENYIVREYSEDQKKAFSFIARNQDAFSKYLKFIDFDLIVDMDNGVAALRNYTKAGEVGLHINRFMLKKVESIILCCLWTIYEDEISGGNLSRTINIEYLTLSNSLEKFGMKNLIDKTTIINTLQLFSRFNLVKTDGRIGDEVSMISLYPSLRLSLDEEAFKTYAAAAIKRMVEDKDAKGEMGEDEQI